MKQYTVMLLALLIVLPVTSQGRRYKKKMIQGIENIDRASTPEEAESCVEEFRNISEKYPGHWLPYYYAAQVLTTQTMGEQDRTAGDKRLDRARIYLDSAYHWHPRNRRYMS